MEKLIGNQRQRVPLGEGCLEEKEGTCLRLGGPQPEHPGLCEPAQAVLDGAEVARRMMQATEAASAAAQAAQVLQNQQQGRRGSEPSWFKTLPKPSGFNPGSREEELSLWRETLLGACVHGEFVNDFKDLRERPERPVDPSL